MKLHQVIKTIREDKKITQEKLAAWSGLTRGYISRLEAGAYGDDSPSIKTLRQIAKGLGEPLDLILARAGITQESYVQNASTPTFLRSKYGFNESQIQDIEAYIEFVKSKLQ